MLQFICGMKLNRNSRSSWSLLHFDETEIEVLEDAHEWNKQFNRKIGAKKSSPNNQLENELKKQLDEENEEKFVPLEEEEDEFRKARFQGNSDKKSFCVFCLCKLFQVFFVLVIWVCTQKQLVSAVGGSGRPHARRDLILCRPKGSPLCTILRYQFLAD